MNGNLGEIEQRIISLKSWMAGKEDENLEFKEAKAAFDTNAFLSYCCAIANEGGGHLIFGVTDKKPREIIGSDAFRESKMDEAKRRAVQELGIRVDVEELTIDGKRILIFSIPSRQIGKVLKFRGRYLMRAGESLVDMTDDALRIAFDENILDFSSEINLRATIEDLDGLQIDKMKERWSRKSRRPEILSLSNHQALQDLGLISGDKVTQAAIVLLGKEDSVKRIFPNSEVVLEYRNSESEITYQDRTEFKKGFFGFEEDLWQIIDKRNASRSIQAGFFKSSIKSFNEEVVREAILNAVSHREYRDPGSIFIKQYDSKLEIQSPGGFPRGVDPTNILWNKFREID